MSDELLHFLDCDEKYPCSCDREAERLKDNYQQIYAEAENPMQLVEQWMILMEERGDRYSEVDWAEASMSLYDGRHDTGKTRWIGNFRYMREQV